MLQFDFTTFSVQLFGLLITFFLFNKSWGDYYIENYVFFSVRIKKIIIVAITLGVILGIVIGAVIDLVIAVLT